MNNDLNDMNKNNNNDMFSNNMHMHKGGNNMNMMGMMDKNNNMNRNNELEDTLKQTQRKLEIVENNIKELSEKHQKLDEKKHFIETSIDKTKAELDDLQKIQQSLDFELDLINKNKVKLLNEARALQDKNLIVLSNKETHEKQGDNLEKANQNINKEMFDLLVEKDSKANEIIRVQIDKINVESQNIKLHNKRIRRIKK